MDDREFARRAKGIGIKLYRVSCTLLSSEADREDALQEALLRAWSRRASLRQPEFFDTWLIRILINECRNIQRKKQWRPAPLPERMETPAPEPKDPALYDALMALPEKYRLAIELHYIEGFSVREIAQMLGVPGGTVMWRLSEARKLLKCELEVGER